MTRTGETGGSNAAGNGLTALRRFRWGELALPIFAIASVFALLLPLPTAAMDALLSVNLAVSTAIFLSAFFVRKPIEFGAFPTVLLTTTLFRLALNVSTTKLILTQGNAGRVVDAFAGFVAGNSPVVGAVVFLIFVIIQFVVITKGATRISEVAARFALDALPGRQTTIDADLNAGTIDDAEAKVARVELSEEADFYGAMDGASKFVRGDAVAGLAIVLINIIGGLVIGIAQKGLSPSEAFGLYSRLTIGDGLVSQIPAFLISLATGLLVARTSRSQSVSEAAVKQTFGKPIVLSATGVFLLLLATTGLPIFPLATLACGCFALAWALSKSGAKEAEEAKARKEADDAKKKAESEDDVEPYLTVDPAALEVGVGLIPVVAPEPESGEENLLDRVRRTRRRVAEELGIVLPKTRVRDDSALDDDRYVVKIKGETVASGIVYPERLLAVEGGGLTLGAPKGLRTTSPLDGKPAYWIDPSERESAIDLGFDVWSPGDVLENALLATVRREAAELLDRDATKRLVDRLRATAPTVVDEVIPEKLKLAQVQQILQLLLKEGVSIRPLDVILETLGDRAPQESNPFRLLDFVRARLARTTSEKYRDEDGTIRVAMFEPEAEEALREAVETTDFGVAFAIPPEKFDALGRAVRESADALRDAGFPPVLLVDRSIRLAVRDATATTAPDLTVLSFDEIDKTTKISQECVVSWRAVG